MEEKNISAITRRDFIRRAACAAVGTVAMRASIRDLRLMNAAMAQSKLSDYKALVCVFLQGGNDSNNLVIPTVQSEYNNYAAIRTPVLAIPQSAILSTGYTDGAGHSYGLHPACPELIKLFGENKVALLLNTGTLVYPMTKAQYFSNALKKPPQLFSHADQQVQWQTSVPDQPPTTGWGGRCADLLNSMVASPGQVSLCISLAGSNTFEVGNIVSQYSVSTSGAISLSGVSGARLAALTNLLGLNYLNLQEQAYAGVGEHSIQSGALLNNAITNTAAPYWTNPFPLTVTNNAVVGGNHFGSSLAPQLQMVARLIEAGHRAAASGGFGMNRQIFFCQVGGYDLHTGQTSYSATNTNGVLTGAHSNLFSELSQSLYAFQRAMEQLEQVYPGISKSVTAFTASDFSRTFPSNGQGSDHGWGSHHIIVGGAVNGGKTYGTFPTLAVNGPDDTGTGRWIPTTSTDQYFATLATWFGVPSTSLATIFPNIGRFATSNLGFI